MREHISFRTTMKHVFITYIIMYVMNSLGSENDVELDDVVSWGKSLVPILYSKAPRGELRSIRVTCKWYQIPRKNLAFIFPGMENILQYYEIAIQILDSVYARLSPRGHMSRSRVYEPIYTVKNLHNLQYNS